jgi:crotonyl-CoA carboxylase/reductase
MTMALGRFGLPRGLMAVDTSTVAKLEVGPGELPQTMAAWVIRQEREGEPNDAFQLEQIEVPEPGPFEVIVRVMAAGVNFNNVWAALGLPVSVFGYGDHPQYGHHIGGSDASGIVWKVGEGVSSWKVGDEVVINQGQYSYEDIEVHGLDPTASPSGRAWGYETTWGSFAQFAKVQAQQLLLRPQNLSWSESASYGLSYFTAHRMLLNKCKLQAGHNVLIWGAAGGLGVFATQLCKVAGANAVGVVGSGEKGELVKQLGAVDYVNRNEFGEMMRSAENLADGAADNERFKASKAFAKRVKKILGEAPDIVFEHVGQATFPTSVFVCKPFGKVVICGATTGFQLDFDARYLWMRQKQIIGSHGAHAYESMLANRLMAQAKIRPVLWRTMGFGDIPEAHQLMYENKHLGKISILVGAESEEEGRNEDGPGAIRI